MEDIYANVEHNNYSTPVKEDLGRDRRSRCFVLSTVCLGLMCVLLVTIIIVLCVKLTAEKDLYNQTLNRLQANYSDLTIMNKQLQNSSESLNKKKLELETEVQKLSEQAKRRHWVFISSEEKSWSDSRQYCKDHGGDLVIINSEEEQVFISSFKQKVWIGLSKKEGTMTWVDNSPLNKGFWDKNEPNNDNGNEDCIELRGEKSTLNNWNDLPCSHTRKWICEN